MMRKITFSLMLAAMFVSVVAFGQDELKTKKGTIILPQAGEWAIGMDAVPVVDFMLNAVNIMNNTGTTATGANYVTGNANTIVGKYFVDANTAYRVKVGIASGSTKVVNYGADPAVVVVAPALPEYVKESTDKYKSTDVMLGFGLEKRRGSTRLQGFYGAEAFLGMGNGTTTSSYEFDLSAVNTGSRDLKIKDGREITVGARAFIGVEYFVLPKISIGAEFGWAVQKQFVGQGMTEAEYWNGTAVVETEVNSTTSSVMSSGASVDNASAALTMMFHF